ncbi:hypothetical protein ACQ3I4_12720 [Zafaria sp. Z1313]|uniref:hypothetical protein n=1 Tax=unclassified Zafaria TaxID=2828765 RepID=UPI002E79542B|nr:hypothetical protein [Zafaria sp. J156]MEE1622556.1 hypothetical protein [Zafaria sp. J156]
MRAREAAAKASGARPGRPRRRRTPGRPVRRAARVLAAGAGLAAVVALAAVVLISFPRVDEAAPADALLVLGPVDARLDTARTLMDAGIADTVAYSVPAAATVDEATAAAVGELCAPRTDYEVLCFTPDPFTTQGEAMALRGLAAEHAWTSVNVLTFDAHVTRTRWVMERCWDGGLRVLEYPRPAGPLQRAFDVGYQGLGVAKLAVTRGCEGQLPAPVQEFMDGFKPEAPPLGG